jgi:hypothetical protein
MFTDEDMADWTICRGCMQREMERATGENVFIDQLGIAWTGSELEEAGGINEVRQMASEADVRGKYN